MIMTMTTKDDDNDDHDDDNDFASVCIKHVKTHEPTHFGHVRTHAHARTRMRDGGVGGVGAPG